MTSWIWGSPLREFGRVQGYVWFSGKVTFWDSGSPSWDSGSPPIESGRAQSCALWKKQYSGNSFCCSVFGAAKGG